MPGNAGDRIKGKLEQIGGTVQSAVGDAIGNPTMEAKGKAHELHGKATQEAAKAAERVKGTVEQVVGAVQSAVGGAVGNDHLHAKGEVKKSTGDLRKDLNQ
jgi:uncharacterized protein YjbJ (UPF0337 family)